MLKHIYFKSLVTERNHANKSFNVCMFTSIGSKSSHANKSFNIYMFRSIGSKSSHANKSFNIYMFRSIGSKSNHANRSFNIKYECLNILPPNQVIQIDALTYVIMFKYLGPVVQSVVSLTSSLRVISLTVLADSIYNILIFFAEKM